MREVLAMSPGVRPEYIAITEPETLAPVELVDDGTVIAIAARVGATRLIDNIILGEGLV
jgi:pantoate--beta-alanine ligase